MSNITEERLYRWKDKLIDLSMRNRLLNFKPTKVTTLRIIDELPPEVFRIMVTEIKVMEFLSTDLDEKEKTLFDNKRKKNEEENVAEYSNYSQESLDDRHIDKYLQTSLDETQLNKNLFRIFSKASSVMEEQGHNVLYLALGCLEWYESQDSDIKLMAPIILIPVELSRTSVKSHFKLSYTGEGPILNPALVVKLANDFSIKIDPLPEDAEEVRFPRIYKNIKDSTAHLKRWGISNNIYLSLFSFAKFVMYKDLENNIKIAKENVTVKIICGDDVGSEKVSLDIGCEPQELEKYFHPIKTFQVLDADSSQQQAILAVKNGNNLLIEGPPGTGKSQTISNIISECLVQNKKVLFVSQKMAALEVVKARLDKAGLGDYCLELHSRKTDKKEIIKELARVLDIKKKPDHNHDDELLKLEKLRGELNIYVKELSTPFGKLEMTPFQAFGILAPYSNVEDIGFVFTSSQLWERKKYDNCCDLLDSFNHCLKNIQHPSHHPWYGCKITEISYEQNVRIKEAIESIGISYNELKIYKEKLANAISYVNPSTSDELHCLIEATNVVLNSPKPPKAILENNRWNSLGKDIVDIIDTVEAFNRFKADNESKYDIAIISLNIQPILDRYTNYSKFSFFFLLMPGFWSDRRTISKYKLGKRKTRLKEVVSELEAIKIGKLAAEKIDVLSSLGKELFGDIWQARETNGKSLDAFSKWIVQFRHHVIEKHFRETIFDTSAQSVLDKENTEALCAKVSDEHKRLLSFMDNIISDVSFNCEQVFSLKLSEVPLEKLYKKIMEMRDSLDNVGPWLRYQLSLSACNGEGLEGFIQKILSMPLNERIVTTFKCQFLKSWISCVFMERSYLKKFYGENHAELIEQFRSLDKKQLELAKVRIQHLLSGDVKIGEGVNDSSEVGILLRESRKMRAHKPIRRLFKEIPRLILGLKPCLMMSPISVAQFLDPTHLKFDVIIFDEASQIPPEDSIGSIIRGKQVVVAGDSKQLPPTSFFQSEVLTLDDAEEDGEEALPEDLGSILDECAATNRFPKTMLRWHYRSRHEDLIAFSNINLYDSQLNTFPCPEERSSHLGIKFNYLPSAVYGRGVGGVNVDEAREVAKAALKHFKDNPSLSLGVGTFNIRQKYAIEDAIDNLLREDSSLESLFAPDRLEHFFVKNLENIQGDERDIIFLSIGYGKDQGGRLSMNFGPLNQIGGDRRLNVIITRARLKVEVFSSIKGDDFDLSKTESKGVHLLKKYLDFADKGRIALLQETDATLETVCDSPFEEAVYNALANKGINVRKQVGCSGYKIDLAVVDDKNPGRYILGIECDGANYHSCATARDRDRLRQYILEDLGWYIYRVWSTDWFKSSKTEIGKLLAVIEKCRAGELHKKVNSTSDYEIELKNTPQEKHSLITPYVMTPIRQTYLKHRFFEEGINRYATVLKTVVQYESPIHREEAWKRFVQHWGIGAIGSRIRAVLETTETYCINNKMFIKKGDFFWFMEMTTPMVRSRDSGEAPRDIEFIAPEEICEAAIIVLKQEYSIPWDGFVSQVAGIFGINRVSESMSKYIIKSLNRLVEDKRIIELDERLTLSS